MPYNELHRRDSWPPTILRLHEENIPEIEDEDIDVDPFSYFLTSPEDIDDDAEDLSAGIESDDDTDPPVRSVSPSSLQGLSDESGGDSYHPHDVAGGFAAPLSLRDFTNTRRPDKKDKAAGPQHDFGMALGSHPPKAPALRGRRTVRLTPTQKGRGRGHTRSLSAGRPRSWREPSPDVWSIPEEEEGNAADDDIPTLKLDGIQKEVRPDPPADESAFEPPKKLKKKVRWALP